MTKTATITICCLAGLMMTASRAAGQDWDLGEYQELAGDADETQVAENADDTPDPVRVARVEDRPEPVRRTPQAAPVEVAKKDAEAGSAQTPTGGQVESETAAADGYPEHVIRFGAGASWLHPMRLADRSSDDKLLSDFSASWTPFGLPADLGVDLLIARDQQFFVRPNLKLFLVRHYWFSMFIEGTCELMFLSDSTELGGGGGFGMVIGLSDSLAFEIKASATVANLSSAGDSQLFGATDPVGYSLLDEVTAGKHLAVMPSASIHLMARF